MSSTSFKPTTQQQQFIDALVDPREGHLCLRARAGCGKTATILMGVDAYSAANPGHEMLVCAFNRAIADEVKDKLIARGHTDWRRVSAATAHSLGLSTFKFMLKPRVDDNKVRAIIDEMRDAANSEEQQRLLGAYGSQINLLVHLAKQAGFGFFPDRAIGSTAAWHELADHHDVNGLDDTSEADAVVEAAQRVYRASLGRTDVVDFDDMILFPLVKNIRVKFTKDLIFVDEAQDLSRARQALIRKFLSPGGKMVIVGDDRQSIYGFTGADSSALDNQIEQFGARVMPLSVTWRCPKAVVALANTLVPDIEAADAAPDGQVVRIPAARNVPVDDSGQPAELPWYEDPELAWPLARESAILCRNTAPLVKLAYKLIRAGKPCKVEGRSIGDGLKALAMRWKVTTIDALRNRIKVYAERERQKALAKGNESKAEEVTDRTQTLLEICDACNAQDLHARSDVVAFIDGMFSDGASNTLILATYHRSKGREWENVFLLEHEKRCPSRAARKPWQRLQEDNLAYVAITRAQRALIFVD